MKWISLLILFGCTQVASLNLKRHQFGIQPTKIIWFQVAGLEEEQVAMLRFQDAGEKRTSFEMSTCVGKTWDYNLYDLRTAAYASFLSQLTGKKNIKSDCSDTTYTPIWSYLDAAGYNTGVLEVFPEKNQSLLSLEKCESSLFLKNLHFWLRAEPPKEAKTYLFSQQIPMIKNKYYYDRTCNQDSCSSNLRDNVKSILQQMTKYGDKYFFIIRDFSYYRALVKKDFLLAKKILLDLEKTFRDAQVLAEGSDDYLVLLTTGESKFLEMPDAGVSWYDFEKNGSKAQLKKTKLTNLVLATGSRAENFCGVYEDAQIFERILSGPKQQGLEFKFINPFKN